MKTLIGLFILVVLLIATSGCTSQPSAPAETATTPATTEVLTPVNTPLPTTILTKVPTITAAPVTSRVTTAATPQPTITASVAVTTIHIRNNTFVPAELTVLPGTGISWINDDSVIHIVKATGNASGKFTSAELINGARFMYTFGEATGTYEFWDPTYPAMTGRIIIKKGETLWVATNSPAAT